MDEEIRLNKYLSDAGVCSRREADRLIAQGLVTVDGHTGCTGEKIRPDAEVLVEGRNIRREAPKVVLAVHKPRGVVCSTDRRWGDQTLEDMVHYPVRVFGIGRLDKDSEGLILMTNDGDLANAVARSRNGHEKEYEVRVDRPISRRVLRSLSSGVYLKELDRTTKPCTVIRLTEDRFRIVLTEGLNRQIRRMCEAFGFKVVRLKRVRVMNVLLGDLAPGKWRKLSEEEYQSLKRECAAGDSEWADVPGDRVRT